jgi:hypothetical protein
MVKLDWLGFCLQLSLDEGQQIPSQGNSRGAIIIPVNSIPLGACSGQFSAYPLGGMVMVWTITNTIAMRQRM